MGGRGSGGGKGGGLGGSRSDAAKYNKVDSKTFSDQVKGKLAEMNDKELNRAIINSRNLMNNETAKLAYETNKLRKMNEEFKNMKADDPNSESKWNAIEKQMAKVSEQQSYANARAQIHYLAINEKNNVRANQVADNLRTMTNGQLNSFYHKSYNESMKARYKAERTNNKKTYNKNFELHKKYNSDFWKASEERDRRNIFDTKDW